MLNLTSWGVSISAKCLFCTCFPKKIGCSWCWALQKQTNIIILQVPCRPPLGQGPLLRSLLSFFKGRFKGDAIYGHGDRVVFVRLVFSIFVHLNTNLCSEVETTTLIGVSNHCGRTMNILDCTDFNTLASIRTQKIHIQHIGSHLKMVKNLNLSNICMAEAGARNRTDAQKYKKRLRNKQSVHRNVHSIHCVCFNVIWSFLDLVGMGLSRFNQTHIGWVCFPFFMLVTTKTSKQIKQSTSWRSSGKIKGCLITHVEVILREASSVFWWYLIWEIPAFHLPSPRPLPTNENVPKTGTIWNNMEYGTIEYEGWALPHSSAPQLNRHSVKKY